MVHLITDAQQWDNLLKQLPTPHVLQGWLWGAFKSRWGWQPTRLLWRDEAGNPCAAAQILRRPLWKSPWSMLYVSKGPVWDYHNLALVERVLTDLETFARQQKAIFIKIDPDIPLAFEPGQYEKHLPGQLTQRILLKRGWQLSPQQIQFKNTVLLNLEPPEEDLLAAMKSKWRYNIRLAGRRGVEIINGSLADLETFYQLYHLTSQRDGFLIRPQAYYMDVWRTTLSQSPPAADLLLAKKEGQVIAGVFLFYFGETAWYLYGASDNHFRQDMPNHLLQWAAIKAAKARGCTTYDMWGAPDVFDESDSMWGVYRFKVGFAGLTCQGLGAYDYPTQLWLYRLYMEFLPKILDIWRRTGSRE